MVDTETSKTTINIGILTSATAWTEYEFTVCSALLVDPSGSALVQHIKADSDPAPDAAAALIRLNEKLFAGIVGMLASRAAQDTFAKTALRKLQLDADGFGIGTRAIRTVRALHSKSSTKTHALQKLLTLQPANTDPRSFLTEFALTAQHAQQDDDVAKTILARCANDMGPTAAAALAAWRLSAADTYDSLLKLLMDTFQHAHETNASIVSDVPALPASYLTDGHARKGEHGAAAPCSYCGDHGHIPSKCPVRKAGKPCESCGKLGHLAAVCRYKPTCQHDEEHNGDPAPGAHFAEVFHFSFFSDAVPAPSSVIDNAGNVDTQADPAVVAGRNAVDTQADPIAVAGPIAVDKADPISVAGPIAADHALGNDKTSHDQLHPDDINVGVVE